MHKARPFCLHVGNNAFCITDDLNGKYGKLDWNDKGISKCQNTWLWVGLTTFQTVEKTIVSELGAFYENG